MTGDQELAGMRSHLIRILRTSSNPEKSSRNGFVIPAHAGSASQQPQAGHPCCCSFQFALIDIDIDIDIKINLDPSVRWDDEFLGALG